MKSVGVIETLSTFIIIIIIVIIVVVVGIFFSTSPRGSAYFVLVFYLFLAPTIFCFPATLFISCYLWVICILLKIRR